MSTQWQQQPPGGRRDGLGATGEGSTPEGFLRGFLILQAAFLLLLLVASINEPPSAHNPASAATQMAIVGGLWGLTDVTYLAVHAIRVRGRRDRA
jgi:hypothetical protein